MSDQSAAEVIQFSQRSLRRSIKCVPLKIRGEVTFSKLKPPLLKLQPVSPEPCSGESPCLTSLNRRLRRLDDEQLQIVEIVAAAIERGGR